MASKREIKSAFESMMFVWGEPLDAKIVASSFEIEKSLAVEYFEELMKEYDEQNRGIRIREINGMYQFVTDERNFEYIQQLCTPAKERRLSQAALEVLAIVAYKQPVTKSEIDSIRGIKSDRVLEGLSKRGLIEDKGRSNAIGKPLLFGTTNAFLTYFDLKSIKELPDIEDIEDVIQFDELLSSGDDENDLLSGGDAADEDFKEESTAEATNGNEAEDEFSSDDGWVLTGFSDDEADE